jgi:predicted Zn-dependent protease
MPEPLPECLNPEPGIEASTDSTCDREVAPVCLAPMGKLSPDLVRHLVDYYNDTYNLKVHVLPSIEVPEALVEHDRGQVQAIKLTTHMSQVYQRETFESGAVMIALTSVDIYSEPHQNYVFGIKGTVNEPAGVVSTARMGNGPFDTVPQEVSFARTRKMVTKYIGLLYYGLAPSTDPESPLFDGINGPRDLDRMGEPLPVLGN